MKKTYGFILAAIAFVVTPIAHLRAIDLHNVLTDYTLTSWSRKDGLNGPVWGIAQDANGFLWLGTDDGVVRFDGVRFMNWNQIGSTPLPRRPVRTLLVADDKSMWVGFGPTGGIARIQGETAHIYSESEGAATGMVFGMAEDRSHTIWVAANRGVFRFRDQRWQRLGAAEGLPDNSATNIYVDSAGAVWVGTTAGSFWKPHPTDDKFTPVGSTIDPGRVLSLSEDRTGRLWTSDMRVGFRPLGSRSGPTGEAGRGYRLLHDHAGNLWVGTIGQGLWRVKHHDEPESETVEKTTVLSGLSSDAVRSVFEDRDGNIWAGTTEGVDRLVPHRITPWTGLGLVGTIAAAPDGRVWVGTAEGILRFSRTAAGWQPDPVRIPVRTVRDLRVDGAGVGWTVSTDGLVRIDGNRVVRVPLPPSITANSIEALASSHQSGVWGVTSGGLVFRVDGQRATAIKQVDDLKNRPITSAVVDASGQLWVAMNGSQIGRLSNDGEFRIFGAKDGLGAGPHFEFYEDREGSLWICGADGLTRLSGERFQVVTRANGLPAGGVYAAAADDQRNIWLATSGGIIRLASSEFDAAAKTPGYQMHLRNYDTSDGLAGFPVQRRGRNGIRASDGTLWFVTSRGISVADPWQLSTPRALPRASLDGIDVNDRSVRDLSTALSADASRLRINYTAPELTYPLKTRFKYRLDGFDRDWVDAGTRREAFYTSLPPGSYVFRLAVGGEEGRWIESDARWAFSIAPRFYQTWWFYGLLAVATGATVWGSWQLRLRQLRRQFSLVLGERVRLSRELHDTLLQSLVGVALEFDAVSKSIDGSPDLARARVVKIRERVEAYIREARRSIWSLRSPALETGDLLEALREGASRATSEQPVDLEFSVGGVPQRYASDVEHQLLRIGQEAVLNAARHAHARTIHMHVEFSPATVALRVADDGEGFSVDHASETTSDHYGITTMRERAEQVGGRVTIKSERGHGTIVEAVVPVHHAQPEGVSA